MTLFLTQAWMTIESANRAKLKDTYDWHQAVWKAFPGIDGQARDFLMRIDELDGRFRLLIVSFKEPVRPGWAPEGRDGWATKAITDAYLKHSRYRFQLRVNPTRKVKAFTPDGQVKKNGRRVPLVKREELVGWLMRKGEEGGFSVDERALRVRPGGRGYFTKKGTGGLHASVDFEGVLNVSDTIKFVDTFSHGIGSAKAFGFGMLVLAPLPTGSAT